MFLLAGVELGYETYPSNAVSSGALVMSHACIVSAVLFGIDWDKL